MFPRLFQIGNFYLPTYGVLVATGVLLGLWISVHNSEKQGINGDDAWNLGIFMVLAGIIGAKILMRSTTGALTRITGARFSASGHCRQEEFSPEA